MRRQARVGSLSGKSPDGGGLLIDVRIDGLAPGGDAIGRQEGGAADSRATFVALAAPTERIRARVIRQKSRVAWAELVEITQPSPHRVTPPCPLFGRCGGCQWQHVDLIEQRQAKREIVARALGLPQVPLIAPVEDGRGYRDRAQLMVGARGEVGFRARRSHQIVDVPRCLLLSRPLSVALAAVRASAFLLITGSEIDLQAGREGVHVAVRLPSVPRSDPQRRSTAAFARLWEEWRRAGIVGLRVWGREQETMLGAADVDIGDGGATAGGAGQPGDGGFFEAALRIPAGAFAQVGRVANQALMAAVLREVGAVPGAVLELYAGSGNFTRALLARATRVVATDADSAAVARGRKNAAGAVWVDRPPDEVDADTVVLDPPRDGLDPQNLNAALQARRRIVYVSCDPQTLGRDAARLKQAGFTLRAALALDLMPHTFHVEVVATFDRNQADGDAPWRPANDSSIGPRPIALR